MTALIISTTGNYTFGQMTIQAVSRLISANAQLTRLQDAIAQASNGFTGTAGTEFEAQAAGGMPSGTPVNLFGVMPSATAGEQGAAYADAANALCTAWETFWAAAHPYIEQLDNGGNAM